MADATETKVRVETGTGIIWFIGWLFTIGFAQLGWGKAILGLVIWPYYLGIALQ
jgi:hypothetical protein